jgi:predicted Rossmann-fold nucleotide-binding protein
MGAVADGVFKWWRNSHWRYPDFLRSKEIAHNGLTELIVVDSMHEGKRK